MIEIKNLFKKYGDQVVLDGFSHTFGDCGITCLLGVSGAGKSTLFNLLAGFDREYSGDLMVAGQRLADLSAEEIADYRKYTVGFVFQEYHLLAGDTVLENILLAAELVCQDQEKNRQWAQAMLRRLGIEEKANEKMENLSGGQKQRVAIARALAKEPKLILADEPTGALDRRTAGEIMEIFAEIAREQPVLIITHDPKICDYADEVITIEEGKCVVRKEREHRASAERRRQSSRKGGAVSMFQRALHNFRVHFKRFFGVSLAVAVAVCAVLLSFSSQTVIQERIRSFEEKNTAFAWGQVIPGEGHTAEQLLSLLGQSPDIRQCYAQYQVPECGIEFGECDVRLPSKQFGSISAESMNIGVMPEQGEIAITPSLARQFAEDIRTLPGKEITFSCGGFSKKLRISGIYNGSFDDYYLDAGTEQELYGALRAGDAPVSVAYQAKGFHEVLEVEAQLVEKGLAPVTAAKQVESLKETFGKLQRLFVMVSAFIAVIALCICMMLLMKTARMRAGEIGLLVALGYQRKQIRKMLLWESLFLSGVSALITAVVLLLLTALSGVLPIRTSPVSFAASICGTVLFVWLTTAVSNRKLLKTDPAKVLRQ